MNCSTPALSVKEGIDLPLQLNISFIMDDAQLMPEENNFTLFADPIYERFDEAIRRIDSTGLVHIRVIDSSLIHNLSFTLDLLRKGSNLISSHSMDQLNIHVDRVQNACLPLKLTDTELICTLSESAVREFQHDQPYLEVSCQRERLRPNMFSVPQIHVSAHLVYPIGQITFENGSQSVSLLVASVPQSFGVWPIFILIILSLSSICTLFLSVLMITRRRFYQSIHYFDQTALPPFYLQSLWNDFDQQYRIERKQLILSEKIGQGCFVDIHQGEWKQSRKKSLSIAVKILRDRTISSMFEYLTEINRTKSFSHRNVLSLLGITWDATREAMVIYPLMNNGDLRNFLSNQMHQPTMRQLLKWAVQVSDGMEYLTSMKFVHRDLAARNCLLDEEFVCRIADFSLTRDLLDRDYCNLPISAKDSTDTSAQNRTRRVPIRWLSPEAIESATYTTQSDIVRLSLSFSPSSPSLSLLCSSGRSASSFGNSSVEGKHPTQRSITPIFTNPSRTDIVFHRRVIVRLFSTIQSCRSAGMPILWNGHRSLNSPTTFAIFSINWNSINSNSYPPPMTTRRSFNVILLIERRHHRS